MSAFAAICTSTGVELVTDGATYTPEGIYMGAKYKAHRHTAGLAISSSRGFVRITEGLGPAIDDILLCTGSLDRAMEILARIIERDRPGEGADLDCDMVIAGISESRGPIVYRWSTVDSDAGPAFVLRSSKFGFACDVEFTAGQHAGLMEKGGLKACGVQLMEYLRTLKAPQLNAGGRSDYFVGGHVDFTCLGPDGIDGERLHTWEKDRIGERLDPFRAHANVVPISNSNRQQRRALDRQRRKLPA